MKNHLVVEAFGLTEIEILNYLINYAHNLNGRAKTVIPISHLSNGIWFC